MMKKDAQSPLRLSKETLHKLADESLEEAIGGLPKGGVAQTLTVGKGICCCDSIHVGMCWTVLP